MEFLTAVVLGFVQGITEFLPISSSGHLILVREVFSIEQDSAGLAFDAVLHLATTCAILLYFWRDLMRLVHTLLRKLGRLPVDDRDMALISALTVGTIPAVILGFLLEDLMETTLRSPLIVAATLVVGSGIFAYAEYVHAYRSTQQPMSPKLGFKIGLFQTLALIPGMSRSGISISGGLILGLSRYEAARFAFLLAIPVMTGAGLKMLLELLESSFDGVSVLYLATGAVTSFFVGLCAIHFMMNFMRTNSLWPFIWYRILLAFFVIALVFFG